MGKKKVKKDDAPFSAWDAAKKLFGRQRKNEEALKKAKRKKRGK